MIIVKVCVFNDIFFRENEESLEKLRQLLTDAHKIRRRRRILLNIHITVIAWLLECLGSISVFLMIFLTPENGTTRGLQLITGVMYFIVVPSVYLMNSSDVKSVIVDNRIYLAFVNQLYPRINQIAPVNNNNQALN